MCPSVTSKRTLNPISKSQKTRLYNVEKNLLLTTYLWADCSLPRYTRFCSTSVKTDFVALRTKMFLVLKLPNTAEKLLKRSNISRMQNTHWMAAISLESEKVIIFPMLLCYKLWNCCARAKFGTALYSACEFVRLFVSLFGSIRFLNILVTRTCT
jgi:hypothetical protein